jgi:hypothetical protein
LSGTINAPESRVNVLLRLVGMVFFALGAALTFLTYEEAMAADLVPQIVPVFYLCAGILMIAGVTAIVAKYK